MVSVVSRTNSGFGDYLYSFVGLSTDTKPKTSNGSTFKEIDTGASFIYNGEEHDWIGEATKYLKSIAITTAPTKTTYLEGDEPDLTGIAVTATYTDDSTASISADDISVVDEHALTVDDDSITIKYKENGIGRTAEQAITVTHKLVSISFTTAPTKVEYVEDETLDLTGAVVTAVYSDSETADVTADCTFTPANGATLTTDDTAVTASYTESGVTKTGEIEIAVTEAPVVLSSISFAIDPQEREAGEELIIPEEGVIIATYSDGSTKDVTASCTFNPPIGTVLTLENNGSRLTATYKEGGVTKTTWKTLSVVEHSDAM